MLRSEWVLLSNVKASEIGDAEFLKLLKYALNIFNGKIVGIYERSNNDGKGTERYSRTNEQRGIKGRS